MSANTALDKENAEDALLAFLAKIFARPCPGRANRFFPIGWRDIANRLRRA
jgi:hypothetical protein